MKPSLSRALSAENIASLAHSTFDSLRRMIAPNGGDDGDLPSLTRVMEERCVREYALDPVRASAFAALLQSELQGLCATPTNSAKDLKGVLPPLSTSTPTAGTPVEEGRSSRAEGAVKRKPATEAAILGALDCLRIMYRTYRADAATLLVEHRVFHTLLDVLAANATRKMTDAAADTLVVFVAEPCGAFVDLCDPIAAVIADAATRPVTVAAMVPSLRCLMAVHGALRRADLVDVEHSNQAKSRLAECGAITTLLETAARMQALYQQPGPEDAPAVALTVGVVCIGLLAGLTRSNVPNKEELLKGDVFGLWSFYVSHVAKMECTFAHAPEGSRGERQSVVCESVSVWAGELAEFIIELCVLDSFSLTRQTLYADSQAQGPDGRGGAAAVGGSITTVTRSASKGPDPLASVRKWEPLPSNWDALVADSVFTWRMASAAACCTFASPDVVRCLVGALLALDMEAPTTDYVFRTTLSNIIILCRASPTNIRHVVAADTFRRLITTMTVATSVLTFPDLEKPHASVKLGHQNWPTCMALLTVILHTCARREEISVLLRAVRDMTTAETTAEDCEIIEHAMQVLAATTYPEQLLWFSSENARVTCPVDRFAGRWYGYSFVAWVNPLCIWSSGSHLFSYTDPSTQSSVTIAIAANGKTKCLTARSTTGRETLLSLLPDTALCDGWNLLVIAHNFSGFFVYINGVKRQTSSASVPYPKEASRPHKLTFEFGGSADTSAARPFFGHMAGVQLVEGSLADKDIERLFAAGPTASAAALDPPVVLPTLLRFDTTVSGTLATDKAGITDVFVHRPDPIPGVLADDEDVLEWFIECVQAAPRGPNRNTVLILCIEMLIVYARVVPDGTQRIYDRRVLDMLAAEVLSWDAVPCHLPPVLIGLVQQPPSRGARALLPHPLSVQVLTVLMDMVAMQACPAVTRNQIFRDLSALLGDEANLRHFKEGPKLVSVLAVCPSLQRECVDDCVVLIEKLLRDAPEVDGVLRFLAFEHSPRIAAVKCEVLRMLYDVAQANPATLELLAAANAVQYVMVIIGTASEGSEYLRAYAIRLLALLVAGNRKQRDAFARIGGFEALGAAITESVRQGAPLKLSTFNFLFKFALGFFQPSPSTGSRPELLSAQLAANTSPLGPGPGAPSRPRHQQYPAMNGHLPSLIPAREGGRRQISVDLTSFGDQSDPDARLSIDDCYNSQSNAHRSEVMYPQLLQIIFGLLPALTAPTAGMGRAADSSGNGSGDALQERSSSQTFLPPSMDAISEHSGSSGRREDDALQIAVKVVSFAERVLDIPRNADAMLPHPWHEWLWAGVGSFIADGGHKSTGAAGSADATAAAPIPVVALPVPAWARTAIDRSARNIVRSIALADLRKPKSASQLRAVRHLPDLPMLQALVLEEVLAHFSTNNRLDALSQDEATNVIRNLDALLQGIDEVMQPLPHRIGLLVADAVAAITVHSNGWVRNRVRSQSKLLETRDRLVFRILATEREFRHQTEEFRRKVLEANMHDQNAAVVLLRGVAEHVAARSVEGVESLQAMLRQLCRIEVEQRRTVERVVEAEVAAALLDVPPTSAADETFLHWCVANEGRWLLIAARIAKAVRQIDQEVKERVDRTAKEGTARSAKRRVDLDRRHAATAKALAEYDRAAQEITSRKAAFDEAMEAARAGRRDRNEIRRTSSVAATRQEEKVLHHDPHAAPKQP